jgi:ornithine cyclodeaminase
VGVVVQIQCGAMPLLLTEADVRAVLSMDDLIDAMQGALVQFAAGAVVQPLRQVLQVGPGHAFLGLMPAYVNDPPALGTKLVTVFGRNAEKNLPTHLASILLLDPETGELLCLMDGRYITEARTAAVSAVSARHMARPGASVLAILGSGVQAWSHLEALTRVRPVSEVRVWSRTAEHARRFVERARAAFTARVEVAATPETALRGADLVALTTASPRPVAESRWVADGAHVCAVGACRPDQREMDSDLVARARLVVDSRQGALNEAGDIVLPMQEGRFGEAHIAAELGEVAAGRVPGRASDVEVTIFKSLGMAVEDVAAAHLAYRRASAVGLGRGFLL